MHGAMVSGSAEPRPRAWRRGQIMREQQCRNGAIYRKALSVTNCVTLLIWSHDLKHPDQMEYCAVTEWEISEG